MRLIFLFMMVLGTVTACSQKAHENMDSLIEATIRQYQIPGLAVSLIKKDTCLYSVAGVNKIGGSEKIKLSSKFHLGSNTKAITSFIAMKMVEANQIQLETKFVDVFPELKNQIRPKYLNVILGDLLSHYAFIQPYTAGDEFEKLPELSGNLAERKWQFAKFVLNEAPVKLGTYSNAGYVLAALMLAKRSGHSFEDLIGLTMQDLQLDYFFGFPNKEDLTHPWGHWEENNTLVALDSTHFYQLEDFMLPAGDLSMNIVDYANFVQLHLNGLTGDPVFLKGDSYSKMHFGLNGYSLGWGNNQNTKEEKISYHDGSAGTYYCHTVLIPHLEVAVAIMMNAAGDQQIEGIYALRELILQRMDDFVK